MEIYARYGSSDGIDGIVFNGGTGDSMAPQCLWCQIPDKGKEVRMCCQIEEKQRYSLPGWWLST